MKWVTVKHDEKPCFILCSIDFCLSFIGHVEKRLDKKGKVKFKIYGVTNWETSIKSTRIAQYLKK